jgi:hypothetical protein
MGSRGVVDLTPFDVFAGCHRALILYHYAPAK